MYIIKSIKPSFIDDSNNHRHHLQLLAIMKSKLQQLPFATSGVVFLALALLAFVCLVIYPKEFQLQSLVSACRSSPSASLSSAVHLIDPVTVKPDFRLLLGVLTRPDLYERRHLLRLVYSLQQTPDLTAQVDVRFVFCGLTKEENRVLVALEIMRYDDIIILNCTENMNEGKTYTYFSSLPRLFDDSPYDFVVKADDDIYFRLPKLIESLNRMPREDLYYGFVIPCDSMDPFYKYMSGMGYLLSWDLVEWVATSEFAKNNTVGAEDMMTGMWLTAGKKGKNRYNTKYAMYDYPIPVPIDACSHEFVPDTIAVHRLKDNLKWARTLKYLNVTQGLKPSKFYHFD
ncbi:beta-1,3-galactosyltransferase pvg3-like [Canna indica]|uniref:Hexosyltransferase n=1 Tax=Canna indica TaxID=4628 RepID=A0AAQ3L9Y9_9LILI|nr:beta-1,3-galactosyltransferase pvg3-like [Canna indica]